MPSFITSAAILVSSFLFKFINMFTSQSLSAISNAYFTALYSGYWLTWPKYNESEHRVRHAAHKKYGPVIRPGPSEICINCIEDGLQTVYGAFEKTSWYSNFVNYG
jgi:hypothetical protein